MLYSRKSGRKIVLCTLTILYSFLLHSKNLDENNTVTITYTLSHWKQTEMLNCYYAITTKLLSDNQKICIEELRLAQEQQEETNFWIELIEAIKQTTIIIFKIIKACRLFWLELSLFLQFRIYQWNRSWWKLPVIKC